jgi:ABC-2 type transport system ATP-binding protein
VQTLVVDHVAKSFARTQAVRDVSFAVESGEIFALLGPNGAGKTTTIRMILDLIRPDAGSISVLGGPTSDAARDRIGYLPEDRGLYRGMKLLDCLAEAKRRALALLERFELAEHAQKKVSELSRGMQQKAQLIAALQHAPALVIVDEPFAGLDPVNVRLIKDVLREQAAGGTTIILSAHEMHLVQEIAGRMVMLNRGEAVLYGPIADVRRSFAPNAVLVEGHGQLGPLPGVMSVQTTPAGALLQLEPGASPQAVLRALGSSSFFVERFEVALPTLDDIFVQVAQGGASFAPALAPEAPSAAR